MDRRGATVAAAATGGLLPAVTAPSPWRAAGDPTAATVALVAVALAANWGVLAGAVLVAGRALATYLPGAPSARRKSRGSGERNAGNRNAGERADSPDPTEGNRGGDRGISEGSAGGAPARPDVPDRPQSGESGRGASGDDGDPLDSEVRRAIYGHVRDSPGTYPAAVVEATGVTLSTVRYHLRVLGEAGLVEEEAIGGRRRLYPAGSDRRALAAAMADEATASVLRALARSGPATVSELADRVDRAPSTLSHHLSRLEDEGLVVRERDGVAVVTRLAPAVRAELDAREGSDDRATAEG